MPVRKHVLKRLDVPLTLQEKDQLVTDFIEFAALHNIDVSSYKPNRRSVWAFIDHLGGEWEEWSGVPDDESLIKSALGKSLLLQLKAVTGLKCSIIRGKVAKRKIKMDAEDTESDYDDQIVDKEPPATTRKQTKLTAAKQAKDANAEAAPDKPPPKAAAPAKPDPPIVAPIQSNPEVVKSFPDSQTKFTEDTAALWTNTKLLQGNRKERKTLLKERE
jgi:hypothetical protein